MRSVLYLRNDSLARKSLALILLLWYSKFLFSTTNLSLSFRSKNFCSIYWGWFSSPFSTHQCAFLFRSRFRLAKKTSGRASERTFRVWGGRSLSVRAKRLMTRLFGRRATVDVHQKRWRISRSAPDPSPIHRLTRVRVDRKGGRATLIGWMDSFTQRTHFQPPKRSSD